MQRSTREKRKVKDKGRKYAREGTWILEREVRDKHGKYGIEGKYGPTG